MREDKVIESYAGVTPQRKKSKNPAKLDFWQSATGLFLALFMILHMFFVASILISRDAMYAVAKFFEGSFLIEGGNPYIVSVVAVVIIIALVAHAFLAVRKFPINYRQFLALKVHKSLMKHSDTSLWAIQAFTGFVLFFTATVHLFIMLTQPDTIGPNGSAYRFWSEHFWILYIVLLFAVELHASIGLYRLCIKWGWLDGLGLKALRTIKWLMSAFFIILGLATFAAYMMYGISQTNPDINYKHYDAIEFGGK
ncbi:MULTISPECIES: fumarate reductase cytochrome b subunit [Helicobacter]|uniref:Fumarate reductase cytochrome b subunit n=1 Tax=Helicobacter typhlonius TaxID=76936 RepID=A0A099UC58_9HELI|nr:MULTISPECIES: fumarate reductase cytochrome b subunit [Helicobacter]TLD78804.1 fumarate reductase cytochrome b subunit [Helicobacter typhlonius]TLD90139.1 fumarate reductase cytochrome b subunit [Helicobacter sp. MIT 03-1616]CUU40798.1 Fumarate reductase cytochrome b subunit [Helicobacter typhlonius]HCD73338.1 fumarate reductase cytochrome subunit b [Helicobacter sp.]